MDVPPVGPDGVRQTVNTGLTDDQRVWYFRSAWNVAALNCIDPQYQPILDGYSAYIKDHARALKQVNDRLEQTFRDQTGNRREAIIAREEKMTRVYNFFALPPARDEFCAAALDVSNRALAAPELDPAMFAMANFDFLRQPFDNFFQAYEQYQVDSAAWDARYGERYGSSQPGYLAAQQARAESALLPRAGESDPILTIDDSVMAARESKVTDPETGAQIPVLPVEPNTKSRPIVQPIPTDGGEDDTPQP